MFCKKGLFMNETISSLVHSVPNPDELSFPGKRTEILRNEKDSVDVYVNYPSDKSNNNGSKLPAFINMHGGCWIGGDALFLESFCSLICNELPCVTFNINYKKANVHPMPYQVEEIEDVIQYIINNADSLGVDPTKIVICGESAGSQLACAVALDLHKKGIDLAAQVLIYNCADMFTVIKSGIFSKLSSIDELCGDLQITDPRVSPGLASDQDLKGLCPAINVLCGGDSLKPSALGFIQRLLANGVPVSVIEYETAIHGFVEVNRPDYPGSDSRKTPEQAELSRKCEKYIINQLKAYLA